MGDVDGVLGWKSRMDGRCWEWLPQLCAGRWPEVLIRIRQTQRHVGVPGTILSLSSLSFHLTCSAPTSPLFPPLPTHHYPREGNVSDVLFKWAIATL